MLYEINRVVDTVISVLEAQRPYFDTLVERYYENRSLSVFKGQRPIIPLSNMPSIEVYPQSSQLRWFGCRTPEEEFSLGIDIAVEETRPDIAVDLEGKITTLVGRVLATPPNLRLRIEGTAASFYDSWPSGVQYGTAGNGTIRVARMSWTGKALEHLSNKLFEVPRPAVDFVCHP
jgi:hypothetical protein